MTNTASPKHFTDWKHFTDVPKILCVAGVTAYQWTVRPIMGTNCRFEPSCSDYAITAFRHHGALRGGLLAGRRIMRCNPWFPGGFDPVPCPCPAPSGTAR